MDGVSQASGDEGAVRTTSSIGNISKISKVYCDGVGERKPVIVLAATNMPWSLDEVCCELSSMIWQSD